MEVPSDPYAADSAPRVSPLTYPGVRPPVSALVSDTALREITDHRGRHLQWTQRGPERLRDCRVTPFPTGLSDEPVEQPRLASVLAHRGAAGLDDRIPVLAIGSNAAPSQLRHKFRGSSATLLVPSIRARIRDVRVGFCSFVSSLGYVPATLVPEPGAIAEVALQLLDDQQLAAIDATERTGYRRVWFDGPVALETGEALPGAYAYVAGGGYLRGTSGPWILGATGEDPVAAADRWFPTQTALLERLVTDPRLATILGGSAPEVVTRGTSAALSARALADAGLVEPTNPLHDRLDAIGQSPCRYGDLTTGGGN